RFEDFGLLAESKNPFLKFRTRPDKQFELGTAVRKCCCLLRRVPLVMTRVQGPWRGQPNHDSGWRHVAQPDAHAVLEPSTRIVLFHRRIHESVLRENRFSDPIKSKWVWLAISLRD